MVRACARKDREARVTSQYLNGIYTHATDGIACTRRGGRDDNRPRYIQDDWLVYELASYVLR